MIFSGAGGWAPRDANPMTCIGSTSSRLQIRVIALQKRILLGSRPYTRCGSEGCGSQDWSRGWVTLAPLFLQAAPPARTRFSGDQPGKAQISLKPGVCLGILKVVRAGHLFFTQYGWSVMVLSPIHVVKNPGNEGSWVEKWE